MLGVGKELTLQFIFKMENGLSFSFLSCQFPPYLVLLFFHKMWNMHHDTWISIGNRDSRKTQAHQHISQLIVSYPLPSIPWNYNQECQSWVVASIWGRWGPSLPAIASYLPLGRTWVWLWNSSKWQWKSLLFLAETLFPFSLGNKGIALHSPKLVLKRKAGNTR